MKLRLIMTFFFQIAWADMDNDGDLDMITARVINDGPVTPLDQDLLWFENDGVPASREPWKMHRVVGLSELLLNSPAFETRF